MAPGVPLEVQVADDRAALQMALSSYFAGQQFAALGGAYADRSLIPSTLLWVNAWRPLPHLAAWAAVLAWAGCAALAVSFDLLAWRARQRLLAVLPSTRGAVRLHFAPAPAPSAALWLSRALVPLNGLFWAHALRPDLVTPVVLGAGSRSWLALVGLWLAVRTAERAHSRD